MHISVHESYFIVLKIYVVHEIKLETYTRYIWVADKEQKFLCVFINSFETYIRYSWVADEEQKPSHRFFFLNLTVDIMKKFYIEYIDFV